MSRANTIQTNFTAGEVSPHIYGRVDVNKYFNGARKLRNMIVMPQGGAFRRPGTKFSAEVKTSAKKTIVRPFKFSEAQPYVLEFGDTYIRFFYDGIPLAVTGTPTDGGTPGGVLTPYLEADLHALKFTQSADVLYITHPSYAPRTLSRVTHTSWTLVVYETFDGPYSTIPREEKLTAEVLSDIALATSSSALFSVAGTVRTITNVVINTYHVLTVTTSVAHGWSNGNIVSVSNIRFVRGIPGHTFYFSCSGAITVVDTTHFTIPGNLSTDNVYVSGGTAVLTAAAAYVPFRELNQWKMASVLAVITTTTASVDVLENVLEVADDVRITYNAGTLTSYPPIFSITDVGKFVRATSGVWYSIDAWAAGSSSTSVPGTALTGVLSYTYPTTVVSVTQRVVLGKVTSDIAVFASTDVGRFLRLQYFDQWIVCKIAGYVSSTVVDVEMDRPIPYDPGSVGRLSNLGVATDWKFGAFSVASGYPAVVAFHQQRLVFGGTTTEPLTLWFGESGDFPGFSPSNPKNSEVTDANAITITLVSKEANQIRWVDSGPVLLVGTEGNEWQVKPSSIQQTLTPTNISATVQTSFGAVNTDESHKVGSQTIFIQRSGKKLREMTYDFSVDAFVSKDLSIISEHIPRLMGGLVEATVQKNPFNVLWIAAGDGTLIGVTYEREHEVVGWHIHQLGGTGLVESVCAIPAIDGVADELYLVVKRTINASTKRYVEILGRLPDPSTTLDLSSGFWVDCGIVLDNGTPTNTANVTGLTHLNTATVQLVVDGIFVGTGVPSAGSVALNYRGTKIHAGLAYEAIIGILEPEGGSPAGSSQGKLKRVNEVTARVENSLHFKTAIAPGRTNAQMTLFASDDTTVPDRNRIIPAIVINTPGVGVLPTAEVVRVETGDITFALEDSYDGGGVFDLVQDEPYPMNIVALMLKLNTNE